MSNKFKTTLMLLCAIVATLCLVSCSNENPAPENPAPTIIHSSNETKEVEVSTSNPETKEVEVSTSNPEKTHLGKYTFTDAMGYKYTLTMKADETVTLECQSGYSSATHYGSWSDVHLNDFGFYRINFPYEDSPSMCFTRERIIKEGILFLNVSDNFLYNSFNAARAKNPKIRLKVKR